MKIRFEKVEIEIPREFVDTISSGLMRLRAFDAQIGAQETSTRNSLVSGLLAAAFSLLRDNLGRPPKPPAEAPAPTGDTQEETGT